MGIQWQYWTYLLCHCLLARNLSIHLFYNPAGRRCRLVRYRHWIPMFFWDSLYEQNGDAFVTVYWSKLEIIPYCTLFLYCPAQLSWMDFTALYRPLGRVPLSLLCLHEPKSVLFYFFITYLDLVQVHIL